MYQNVAGIDTIACLVPKRTLNLWQIVTEKPGLNASNKALVKMVFQLSLYWCSLVAICGWPNSHAQDIHWSIG